MKHFFILGCPRSGTTLLQQALNRHSQIVIPPETKFFYLIYRQAQWVVRQHIARLNSDLRIDLQVPDRRINSAAEGRAFFEEMAEQYLRRLEREDVACFGDKSPEQTSQINRILEVFPQAKLLFIYRDGRDVALSLTRVPWMKCNAYGGFAIWLHFYRRLREMMSDSSLDIAYVKYEHLVGTPELELERIAYFLGVNYEPEMAYGHANTEGIPERERSWKGRALEKITTDRVGTWRSGLTSREVHDLERLGQEAFGELGYDFSTTESSQPSWLLRSRMAWEIGRCAWQLPWPHLCNEVASWLRCCGSGHSSSNKTKSEKHVTECTSQVHATEEFRH